MKPAIVVHVIATQRYRQADVNALRDWSRLAKTEKLLLACEFEAITANAMMAEGRNFPEEAKAIVFTFHPQHSTRYAVLETLDEIASLIDARTAGEPT